MTTQTAILAGGCFWGIQDLICVLPGVIADVDASGLWSATVVTEVAPASDFWEAEPEHQDYLQRYPGGYTCHYVRPEWKLCSGSGSGGTKRTTVESSRDE